MYTHVHLKLFLSNPENEISFPPQYIHSLSFSLRLLAMKREQHVRELKDVDATRRDFLHHQQRVKEARIRRLDDQIKKRVSSLTIDGGEPQTCCGTTLA